MTSRIAPGRGANAGKEPAVSMSMSPQFRKSIAAVLCAAFLLIALPTLATSGGCDDPGNIGACTNKPNSNHSGITPSKPPAHPTNNHVASHAPPKNDILGLRAWLVVFLTGLIR